MTDYAYVGKKGTGKSKHAVIRARDHYLKRGKTVATNLDLDLEKMFGPHSKKTYIRVPDKPSSFDLLAAGHGNPGSYDEDKNGAMILDEMGTWINTRSFNDKDRAGTLDFLAHARKHGWDCYYIMQDVLQVDKQLREAFIEQTCRHVRFDKVKIPFVGWILGGLFGERYAYCPRFHVAVTRMGTNPQDLVADRFMYRGQDIESCYDTRQIFEVNYPHGTLSALSPWHLKGRFLKPDIEPWWKRVFAKPKKTKLQPVTKPDPAYARVLAHCKTLPPAEALRIMARYSRSATHN